MHNHVCYFSLYELVWVLFSWFSGPCSSGILYSRGPLQGLLPYAKGINSLSSRDGELMETSNLGSQHIRLWISVSTPICCWRKLLWWWLEKLLIYEYGRILLGLIPLTLFIYLFCFIRASHVWLFPIYPMSLGYLVSSSEPSKQDEVGAPTPGVGLRLNHPLVDNSPKFYCLGTSF